LIKEKIIKKVETLTQTKGEGDNKDVKSIFDEIVGEYYKKTNDANHVTGFSEKDNQIILKKYIDIIEKSISEIFEKMDISKDQMIKLKTIAINVLIKDIYPGSLSGTVIAGFGDKEIFPSVSSYNFHSVVNNKLRYKLNEDSSGKIDFKTAAMIIPFAQREMVSTFMEGIDPYLKKNIEGFFIEVMKEYPDIIIEKLCKTLTHKANIDKNELKRDGEKLIKKYFDFFNELLQEKYSQPVMHIVSMLPKDELATMAETLVNLTSFKRRVSMDLETVGGPVDVAVISKGDGFVWIKRKHYFKSELNHQFFNNYYREESYNAKK
jgi:hypothetical protein